MDDNGYRERQEDELQVLQSIFMSDYEDLRKKDKWKISRPPQIRLTLKPQESVASDGGIAHVQMDLIISCPSTYPDELPDLEFENSKGLSNHLLGELKSKLLKEAERLKGEEMMLELSQFVQTFLYAHNTPPPMSFYEQMMTNKKKEEEKQAIEYEKKMEILRQKEEKEIKSIEDQIQKRQEALRLETRKRREESRQISIERRSHSPSTPSGDSIGSCSPIGQGHLVDFVKAGIGPSPAIVQKVAQGPDRPTRRRIEHLSDDLSPRRTSTPRCADDSDSGSQQCKDHVGGIVDLTFNTRGERSIHRGTCIGHGGSGSTVYAGIDTKSGELVAIAEWIIKWRHVARKNLMKTKSGEEDKEAETYRKQINSIEQELLSLSCLHHRNLIQYLAFKYQEQTGRITVWLLMEYAGGQNLDVYLTRKRLPLDMLRAYTDELLEALQYLHNKAVVHKNLRASSVFIDSSGRVRLSDYSIETRLNDVYQTVEQTKPGVKFYTTKTPTMGRSGKKADIYQLGILLLSLATGSLIEDIIPVIPSTLPPAFNDFLTRCLVKDERLRWTAQQLLEHDFLKETIPTHFHVPVPVEEKGQGDQKRDNSDEDDEEEDLPLFITAWEASGQSRLTSEFQILKSLGKGGFGDVIKVKNKLDGRAYAIKRIPLNPKSQSFNKKITREVKLLSRLNHENVVRYYNSWIETSEDPAHSDSTSSFSCTPRSSESEKVSLPQIFRKNSLDMLDDIENLAPQVTDSSIDFSISYEPSSTALGSVQFSEDEEEDDDEEDILGPIWNPFEEDSSDGVIFEHFDEALNMSGLVESKDTLSLKQRDTSAQDETPVVPKMQYLYIQMEYCEKSTLRNCIDAGLYQDQNRVWRLFREIVEGLLHIHEQGMIHRDLKPVNIFLDSSDHVKIGDFGLATSSIITKGSLMDATLMMISAGDIHFGSSRSGSVGDGDLTGKVGTALYVSPEMMTGEVKVTYNQKVDIYSLGIIFFEMCYKPLPTGMERVKVLGNIRLPEILFPEDFPMLEEENQEHILNWLLNHNPSLRPTSKELLQSEYIPPSQWEEAELDELLRSTISDPSSKSYRRMINAMFEQNVSVVDDYLYDSEMHKSVFSFSVKTALTQRLVTENLERLFQRHGAIRLNTPLLMPRSKMYENVDQYSCLMDHSGRLVGLPYELRVPFARYIARNNIRHVKRYSIEKVYRGKVFGFHPRELTECAFDNVTSTPGSLIPDAEVLVLVQEVICEFPPLQQRNYYYRINHTSLLKAVLLHVGIAEDQHRNILTSLLEVKRDAKSRSKVLENFGLNEQSSSMLMNYLEVEGPYSKVSSLLKTITKTKGQAGSYAKEGLHELEALLTNAENLGLKLPVIVSIGWVHNIHLYEGMIFQVTVDVTRKKKTVSEVFAAGGRYDKLLRELSPPRLASSQSGVGVSIAFEKIITALMEQEEFNAPSAYDVLVCTIGHKPLLKERMNLVKDLWAAGLKTEILLETLEGQEEIQDFCRGHGISQLVILKDSEAGSVRMVKVRSIERERVTEKVLPVTQLVKFLQQTLTGSRQEPSESLTSLGGKTAVQNQTHSENTPHPPSATTGNTGNTCMTFTFIMPNGKLASNTRRKFEAMIVSKVSKSLPWLALKSIEVVALELSCNVLRVISALLDVESNESAFEASISTIMEQQPRYRKYISKITDHIHQLIFKDKCTCVVLYGTKDDSVKLLTVSAQ